jgi:hypothetical protein
MRDYQEINDVEWDKLKPIVMTKNTIDKIKKIIHHNIGVHPSLYDGLKYTRLSFEIRKEETIRSFLQFRDKEYEIKSGSIYEVEDEYFYCAIGCWESYSIRNSGERRHYYMKTYKCDQLLGLENLIKDLNI